MGSIITFLVALGISLLIFLILRALVLWYWKIDVIVARLETMTSSLSLLTNERRKQNRIDYYIAVSNKDTQAIYSSLMNIVMDELLRENLKEEVRKQLYEQLKTKYQPIFNKHGMLFPEYDILF